MIISTLLQCEAECKQLPGDSMAELAGSRHKRGLSLIKRDNVSKNEETFHALVQQEGTEGGHEPTTRNGDTDDHTASSGKTSKVDIPIIEEGASLELEKEDLRVGVPYRFKVHLQNLEHKSLIITCDPSDGAAIKIATHEKEAVVSYLCSITPLKEGKFTVGAYLGKNYILGSPFEATFSPAADASLCTVVEALDDCRTSVDKDTVTFCIRTNQERDGLLTASAKSLSSKKAVPVTVNKSSKDHYDVEFDAVDGLKYRLAIKFDNQHVNGSPFFVQLSDASLCTVSGAGITEAIAGCDNSFEVATKEAGLGELSVTIEGKSNLSAKIEPKDDGIFEVTYQPKKTGSYSINVLWINEKIPGSPFLVNCYKAPSVSPPKLDKSNLCMIGESYKFKVETKDAGEGTLLAACTEAEGSANVEVIDKGKGQHRVLVTPLKAGKLPVSIRWRDREVPGSPFELEVEDEADPSQIVTTGPTYDVSSSNLVVLEVNVEHGGAGKLKASCTGEKSGNMHIKMEKTQPKIYTITCEPSKPDIYTLSVTWSKQPIPGSPFLVNLHPPSAQSCHFGGTPVLPLNWQEPAVVTVDTSTAGNGKLEARAEGMKSGALPEEHLEIKETQKGVMEVSLTAPSADIYSLFLTWAGKEIPGSPLRLNRIPPDAEKCIAAAPQFGQEWSSPVTVHIDATQAGNGTPSATLKGDKSGTVSDNCVKIIPTNEKLDHYDITFIPPSPDYYSLMIEWNGTFIQGYPLRLNRNKFQPWEVKVTEPPAGHLKVGQDILLGVNASGGGPGELTATCLAKKVESITVTAEKRAGEEEMYSVFFTPPAEDVYTLSVLWGGENIKGSPFTIDLIPVNASLVKASDPTYPQGLQGPVELVISAEETGKAAVTAICVGGKSGKVPVTVKETSYSQYLLSFTPPQPDLFTMGIKYGNQNIKRSPLYINTYPPNAGEVQVTLPEDLKPGEPVSLLCNTANAGHGQLSVTTTGKKSGIIDTTIAENGAAKFTASFLPETEDFYIISVKWEGEEVANSPFHVNLQPLDPSLIVVEGVHIPEEVGLECASVTINCAGVGVAPVTASASGETVGDVPTEVEDLPDFRRCIKFVPPEDDKYSVSVLFNGQNIPGSPFKMTVISPQPDNVKHVSTNISNEPSPLVCLAFNAEEAGRGKLEAKVYGKKSESAVSEYHVEEANSIWKVSFIPLSPDSYFISCFWARQEIPGSPLRVDLGPPMASSVVVGELHIPAEPLSEVWLDLDCSTAGHAVVHGSAKDVSAEAAVPEVKVKSLGMKCHRVQFIPSSPELFHFSVHYGEDQVPGSPFEVDLRLPFPDKVEIIERSLPEFSDGTQAAIVLNTANAGRGELTATLEGQTTGNIPLLLHHESSKKTYQIQFTPLSPDLYSLHMYWSGTPIPLSPLQFNVLLPICPEKVVCGELTSSCPKKPAKLEVNTSQAGQATLTAVCEGEKSGSMDVKIEKSETDANSHTIIFTPPMEDVYTLSVFYADTAVPNSPFVLDLVPRELVSEMFNQNQLEAEEIVLNLPAGIEIDSTGGGVDKEDSGDAASHLTQFIGEPLTINVAAEDKEQREAPLIATAAGDKTGPANVKVTENADGSRDVFFSPENPDCYRINIQVGGVPVAGSPITVVYQYYTDPTRCYLYDSDGLTLPLRIDQEVSFGVNTTRAGFSELTVTATAPNGEMTKYITMNEEKDIDTGAYRVRYTPRVSGLHELALKWADSHIPGSPLTLNVGDGPAIPIYPNGKPVTLQLKNVLSTVSELTALATHAASNKKHNVNIDYLKPREFLLSFNASLHGMYNINVYQKGTEVEGSPYYVHYAAPCIPAACVVSNLSNLAHIGQTMEFTLDASSAGFGTVSVKPVAPKESLDSTVSIQDHRDGTYAVQYTPQAVGEHLLHVMWSDEAIPGSPFSIQVEHANQEEHTQVHLVEDNQHLFQTLHAVETPVEFTVSTSNAGTGKLKFTVNGPTKPQVRVKNNKNQTYTCCLSSAEPGEYLINVFWNNCHIKGSPFPLVLLPSKAIQILGLNRAADPQHTLSVHVLEDDEWIFKEPHAFGEPVEFRLVTADAGQGELMVSCIGPGTPEVSVSESEGGTQTCKLVAQEIGVYKIFVLWNKIHIPGSPFCVTLLPSKAVQMLGLNASADPGHASKVFIAEEDKVFFEEPQPVNPVEFNISISGGGRGKLCVSARRQSVTTNGGKGKPLCVSAKGEDDIAVELLQMEGESLQKCRLSPTAAGQFCIHILWDRIHIPGSPFQICFTSEKARKFLGVQSSTSYQEVSETDKVHILSEDLETLNEQHDVDGAIVFRVSTKNAGKGVLTITTKGPSKAEIMTEVEENGVYACTFQASVAGKYLITLYWNQERMKNQYELVLQSNHTHIAGINLENAILPVNVAHKFKVYYGEVGRGELELICRPSNAASIKVSPATDTECYECELIPRTPGNHTLLIQYNKYNILGSPFCVHFSPKTTPIPLICPTPPLPHNIRVFGSSLKGGFVGQEGNFIIDTSTAGNANLDFEVIGPCGGFKAQLRQHWEDERKLLARYNPIIPGLYRLVIRWAGIEVPGSPFSVRVLEQNAFQT